jgi:hypothetical protein
MLPITSNLLLCRNMAFLCNEQDKNKAMILLLMKLSIARSIRHDKISIARLYGFSVQCGN